MQILDIKLCYRKVRNINRDMGTSNYKKIEGVNEKGEMTRQEVAFSRKCRKIKGCGSLREDFYTKFKPEN